MHFGGEKVGKHSVRFPWVSIGAASGRALYPCQFATLVGIWIRDHQASIQADFCVQPAISMRWIFGMVFFKQSNIRPQLFTLSEGLDIRCFQELKLLLGTSIASQSHATGYSPASSKITWYSCCLSLEIPCPHQLPSLRILFLPGPREFGNSLLPE